MTEKQYSILLFIKLWLLFIISIHLILNVYTKSEQLIPDLIFLYQIGLFFSLGIFSVHAVFWKKLLT